MLRRILTHATNIVRRLLAVGERRLMVVRPIVPDDVDHGASISLEECSWVDKAKQCLVVSFQRQVNQVSVPSAYSS